MFHAHSIRYSEEAVCGKISLFFAGPLSPEFAVPAGTPAENQAIKKAGLPLPLQKKYGPKAAFRPISPRLLS